LLRYSMQFIVVVNTLRRTLGQLPPDQMLVRVAYWCSLPLYDWYVIRLQSSRFIGRPLRTDTPLRATCAGFWYLYQQDLDKAATAFQTVGLPGGRELYNNTQLLQQALACADLTAITAWGTGIERGMAQDPSAVTPSADLLRPQMQVALKWLMETAHDIELVEQALSPRQRNAALNRAIGAMNSLPQHLATYPVPERRALERIAAQWLKIMLDNASAVGTLEVRQPVASPYIVGALVPPERLAGRADIFAQIQSSWAKSGQRDSLVIYGHRRMGKSSIVRDLLYFCKLGDDTALSVLNLQSVDWGQGLADLCYAIAYRLWERAGTSIAEPDPEGYTAHPLTALRSFLSTLHRAAPDRRYVLILDEYELLDQHLPNNEFVATLRGFTQDNSWLVMALVGLYTLKERSASFYQAIYTWKPIKIGLLDLDGVADVLQVDDNAFPLEYAFDAVTAAFHLTGGQPFLVQLLGDSLVQRFNEQLRVQLEPPPRTFTARDVYGIVEEPRFYEQGEAYFRGIWEQAGHEPAGQQAILQVLSAASELSQDRLLAQARGLAAPELQPALQALCDHDVVVCTDGICRYTVELMRRWVTQQTPVLAEPVLIPQP